MQNESTASGVCEHCGVTFYRRFPSFVHRFCSHRCGLLFRGGKLSPEQIAVAVERYSAGESAVPIAADFGVTSTALRNMFHARGVYIRSATEASTYYTCDHHFFDVIDTEAKAYWLGFIAADGSVSDKVLEVKLAQKDRDHVHRLRSALGSTRPVLDYTYAKVAFTSLAIRSDGLIDGLAQYGVVPRKTFTISWPVLAEQMFPHFTRGFFDGDGWFGSFNPRHPANVAFGVMSNRGFIEGMQRYLMEQCDLKKTKLVYRLRFDPRTADLRISGRIQVQRVVDLLYRDATIYLPRKLATAEQILSARRVKPFTYRAPVSAQLSMPSRGCS